MQEIYEEIEKEHENYRDCTEENMQNIRVFITNRGWKRVVRPFRLIFIERTVKNREKNVENRHIEDLWEDFEEKLENLHGDRVVALKFLGISMKFDI